MANILKKLSFFLLILFGSSLVIFSLIYMAPGDATDILIPPGVSDKVRQRLAQELGMDRNFFQQYSSWAGGIVTLDFGISSTIRQGEKVNNLVLPALKKSLSLIFIAIILSSSISLIMVYFFLAMGFKTCQRATSLGLYLLSAAPVFVLGYWCLYLGNQTVYAMIQRDLISRPEWFPLPMNSNGLFPFFCAAFILALGDGNLLDLIRNIKGSLTEIIRKEYIKAARAKGANIIKHILRAFFPTFFSIASSKISFLLGSVVVIEVVFNMSGAGRLLWEAALNRDYNVVIAITFISAAMVGFFQMMDEIITYIFDPRLHK